MSVTQADRDAAHKQLVGSMEWWNAMPVLAGEYDNHPKVRAFAAHRLAERARIVAWLAAQEGLAWAGEDAADLIERGEHDR